LKYFEIQDVIGRDPVVGRVLGWSWQGYSDQTEQTKGNACLQPYIVDDSRDGFHNIFTN
jgi:hypothetical protein